MGACTACRLTMATSKCSVGLLSTPFYSPVREFEIRPFDSAIREAAGFWASSHREFVLGVKGGGKRHILPGQDDRAKGLNARRVLGAEHVCNAVAAAPLVAHELATELRCDPGLRLPHNLRRPGPTSLM